MRGRLLGSLTLGAIVAAVVVIYDDKANHAALAASTARNHSTVPVSLLSGFVAITLMVALAVLVVGTVAAARGRGRARRGAPQRGTAAPRRRRADSWR